ncbi:putative epsilon-lactone hydrolase [Thelonectria olida]|uniref:Epsilon-lactone hydrolase n=1 Tax=Thelonectria olida TaxID=1576542 RepID=A0A9P9AFU5_9HYPO|nr:putative epsilon-lactone hydrolase [Thelonectria olida]
MTGKIHHRVAGFTIRQKLALIPAIFQFFCAVLKGLVNGMFRGKSGATTYRQHVIGTVLTSTFSSLQLQYLNETFDQVYLKFCKDRKLRPEFVTTASGLTGFWIGQKTAKYIIINFHGGGFAMDGTAQHLKFWSDIQQQLSNVGISTAWFYPTYTLTPHASYPTQISQAVEALRYVLEDLGRQPQEVVLAGDSAGGNLCVAILSHLMHPLESVPKLKAQTPLKGMILMSPWISFDITWPSMTRNLHKDIDSLDTLREWSSDYVNGRASDNYLEPILAPRDWWMSAPVNRTLVVAGENEVFLDPITEWAARNETTFVVANDECHIAPLIQPIFGDFRETHQGQAIRDWLIEELRE